MTELEQRTLYALTDRIVPPDFPGDPQTGSAALPHVLRETAVGGGVHSFLPELQRLLARANDEAEGGDFAALSPEEQDAALSSYEADASFRRLVEIVAEGFYIAPEGMALVGFTPVTKVEP